MVNNAQWKNRTGDTKKSLEITQIDQRAERQLDMFFRVTWKKKILMLTEFSTQTPRNYEPYNIFIIAYRRHISWLCLFGKVRFLSTCFALTTPFFSSNVFP